MIDDFKKYVGRRWSAGLTDSYGLVRDVFKDQFNIELTDWARPDNWWVTNENLMLEAMVADGFNIVDVPVYKVQPADCLLVTVHSAVPNHVGIHLGEGNVLHHAPSRLSVVDPLKGVFRDKLCAVLRHPKAIVPVIEKNVSLIDLVSPATRSKLEKDSK